MYTPVSECPVNADCETMVFMGSENGQKGLPYQRAAGKEQNE